VLRYLVIDRGVRVSQAVLRATPTVSIPEPVRVRNHPVNLKVNKDISFYRDVPIIKGTTAFILPCHNEAADLPSALESIKQQTAARVDTILVVSDNSTDDTVAIARAAGVSVIETSGNRFKKAGALNAGIRHLMELGSLPEFIITGDGDTEYDTRFMVGALNIMRATPNLGVLSAVCLGKPGLIPFPKLTWPRSPKHASYGRHSVRNVYFRILSFMASLMLWMTTFLNYTLIWMQQAEYARAVSLRMKQNIHTMSGAGSVLRTEAIIDVIYRGLPLGAPIDWQRVQVYREHEANLVEDFALTLDVKRAGWKCTNNFYVIARTDLMRDFHSLIRQRVRWVRGTIDELRRRKFSRESRSSTLTMLFGISLILPMYVINVFFISVIFSENFNILDFWILPLMGAYQAIMLRNMGWKSMAIAFVLLPEMLFAVVRHLWIFISIGKSFTSATQKWE
jgi:cellulose synthase/poly-beta-1,6-N-acetylglucosamine synthase-like glycosyltransferase